MTETNQVDWNRVRREAGPYPLEAFNFVRDGLTFTSQQVHPDHDQLPELDRHISGQQLCLGLRDYAIERYGLLARTVLDHWQINRTDDFGRIVFALISAGVMSKADDDELEDFRAVYDFDEAFSDGELRASMG